MIAEVEVLEVEHVERVPKIGICMTKEVIGEGEMPAHLRFVS